LTVGSAEEVEFSPTYDAVRVLTEESVHEVVEWIGSSRNWH